MLGGVTGPAAPPNVHSSQTRAPRDDLAVLRNRTFTELTVGESAGLERTLTPQDIQLFAIESGDVNPAHLDPEFAASTRFHGVVAHGMWGAALISAVLGTRLPGPGTIYLGQTLNFRAPVRIGDTLEVRVTVREKDEQTHRVRLDCTATRQDGTAVIDGEALVLAPTERIELPRTTLPQVRLEPDGEHGVQKLLAQAAQAATASEPVRAAIVHPCDTASLDAVIAARDLRLLTPVVLAPRHKLDAIAQEAGLDLEGLEIVDVPHSHAAAAQAARLAASGAVAALVQGSQPADELMSSILEQPGLRTARRMSHCFLLQTPSYPRPFLITDAAVNIAPSLEVKADIVRNAIDLAQIIGVRTPRVAILAAMEAVNPRMRATIDAAALCKMADRGQIVGGLLDGPLGFDNAVSPVAARVHGLDSPVAGQADVLVVPDMESGTMLVKQLEYLGDARSSGLVLGARVPIVLTNRADSRGSRVTSCALASLAARAARVPGTAPGARPVDEVSPGR